MKRVKQIVMMAFASLLAQCVWAGGRVISINFNAANEAATVPSTEDTYGLIAVPGSSWNNLTGTSSTGTTNLKVYDETIEEGDKAPADATMKLSYSCRGSWHNDSATAPYMKYYLDIDTGSQVVKINFSDIPFEEYDIILYTSYNTDTNPTTKWRAFKVNGSWYAPTEESEGVAVKIADSAANTTYWGNGKETADPTFGENAMRVNNQTGPVLKIEGLNNNQGHRYGSLSAMQIVERVSTEKSVPVRAFSWKNGSNPTGWFTTWGGEPFGTSNPYLRKGPYGLGDLKSVSGSQHPWVNFTVPNKYTFGMCADVNGVVASEDKSSILYAFGKKTGNKHVLLRSHNGDIKYAVVDGNGLISETAVMMIPASDITQGYHFYAVSVDTTTGAAAIYLDGILKDSVATAFTTTAVNGFQLGSVYEGLHEEVQEKGIYLTPAYMCGYADALSADKIAAISSGYPTETTNSLLSGDTLLGTGEGLQAGTGGAYILDDSSTSTGAMSATNGKVVIPEGTTVSAKLMRMLNSASTDNRAYLDLYGTLNITGNSDTANVWSNSGNGGIMFGHWHGRGEYNVYGSLNCENAWMQMVYTAENQTLNINGGSVKVKGINAEKANQATINLTNGGLLRVANADNSKAVTKNMKDGTLQVAADVEFDANHPFNFCAEEGSATTLDANSHAMTFASGAITGSGDIIIAKPGVTINGLTSAYTGTIKLADNATLVVDAKLDDGKVTADVEGKRLDFNDETKTYSLVQQRKMTVREVENTTRYYLNAKDESGTSEDKIAINSGSVMIDTGTGFTAYYVANEGYELSKGASGAKINADKTMVWYYFSTVNADQDYNAQVTATLKSYTIAIPSIAHATVAVTVDGVIVDATSGSITVNHGSTVVATYTADANYVGGGAVTITAESSTTIDTTDVVVPTLRAATDVYATGNAMNAFKFADNTDVASLIDGDVVWVKNGYFNDSQRWSIPLNVAACRGHKIGFDYSTADVEKAMTVSTDVQADQQITIADKTILYVRDDKAINDGAVVSGEGTLALNNQTLTVNGNAEISVGITFAGTAVIKLADGATLTVAAELADGKVTSAVDSKKVVFDEETLTYSLTTKTYTITITPVEHTTVTVDGAASTAESITVDYGTNHTIVYTADENYRLSGEGSFSLTNVTADQTVGEGLSAELDVVTITIPAAPEHATVSVTVNDNPVTVANNTITATIGATVVVTYTAEEGYEPEATITVFTAAAGTQPTIEVPDVKPTRPDAPTATVTTLVKEGLDAAYTFTMDANEPADTSEYYGDWDADFVVTFDKDVAAGSLKLSGQYDGNGPEWIDLAIGDVTAGAEIKLISMVAEQLGYEGLTVPYSMIRDSVKVFNCGVKNLDGNAGTKMTVKLVLSKDGETLVIGEPVVYTLVGTIVIPEEPTITEGELIVPTPEGTETIEIDGAVVESAKVPLDQTQVYTVTAKNANGDIIAESQIGVVVTTKKTGTEENKPTVAVAVPFKGATVANLLDTTNFADDDQLKAFINGAYATWTFKTGKWTSDATYSAEGPRSAPNADTTPLARGSAVWVTTAANVVAFGAYEATAVEPEVTTGYNLIGNPMMTAITPEAKTVGDILIPVGTSARYTVIDKGGSKVWQCSKTISEEIDDEVIDREDISEAAPTVEVGGSVWLIK